MVATTRRQHLDRDRRKKLRAKAGLAMKEHRAANIMRETNRHCHLKEVQNATDEFNLAQRQRHRQPHREQSVTCRQLTVTTSYARESNTVLSETDFKRHNIDPRSYSINNARSCEYFRALLLGQERVSARGCIPVTPCCGIGKVTFLSHFRIIQFVNACN
jgi:hypothetical protein